MSNAPRTAFILGAGLGTRLRPLTARRPKPLIPVGGRPLISHAMDHLLALGVERFVVNTHWCAERYAEFFFEGKYKGAPITFVHESPEVLETAGGIWNARALLGDGPFVVYNGDILSDVPLERAWAHHCASGNEITLVLRSHGGNRNVAFDAGRVLDLRRELRPELEPGHVFTGIYFVEPRFISRIPAGVKMSVVPIFHTMIREGANLGGIVLNEGEWRDLGTREDYLAACAAFGEPPATQAGEGAVLRDCIVWPGGEVAPGARLTRCIVTDGACAEGEWVDKDF